MKSKKLPLLVVVLSLVFTSVFAQDTKNSLDELYVPAENSIFNTKGDESVGDKSNFQDHKNIIIFNPLLLTRSIAALQYQRNITDQFSLVGGIGSAFGKDLIMLIGIEGEGFILDEDYSDHSVDNIISSGELSSRMNLYLNFQTKLYYESFWGFEMAYVALDYRFVNQNYDYSVNEIFSSNTTSSVFSKELDVNTKNHNFNIIFGAESHSSGAIGVYHSLYWGFGIRTLIYDDIRTVFSTNSFGSNNETNVVTGNTNQAIAATLLLGYTIGFGF